jgi:hypothetical protein
MLNYLKKFALDILPSVAATIIGAYIVNHYIAAKPGTPAAAVSSTETKAETKKISKPEAKVAAKPADTSAESAGIPEPGIKAKGISERAMIETRAAESPSEVKPVDKPADTKAADTKPADSKAPDTKAADTKAADAANAGADTRRHATAPNRDANDLARAAIERLRGMTNDSATRQQEAARTTQPETPRLQDAPRTVVAAPQPVVPVAPASPQPAQMGAMIRPLPPPIAVTNSPIDNATAPANPPYTASVDPDRPTPPAEIPPPPPRPPLDLRTGAANAVSHTKNVAEDMLAATKSMFHALVPGSDRNSSSGAQQFTD